MKKVGKECVLGDLLMVRDDCFLNRNLEETGTGFSYFVLTLPALRLSRCTNLQRAVSEEVSSLGWSHIFIDVELMWIIFVLEEASKESGWCKEIWQMDPMTHGFDIH